MNTSESKASQPVKTTQAISKPATPVSQPSLSKLTEPISRKKPVSRTSASNRIYNLARSGQLAPFALPEMTTSILTRLRFSPLRVLRLLSICA